MFPDSRRSQAQRDGQCSHLARGHSPSSGSKGENWVVSNIHIRWFGGLQWFYIYVYIHSYIFVGGFKHLFFLVWVRETLDVWNQSKFHPSKSCTMWWFHTCFDVLPWKLGKMKGFNCEPLGFEWLERIKMHVWSSWLFMLVVHACLCLFLIDEYHVSCTGEMFHISYRCSSWPFREMCSFPREMSESWVIRWNSVDLRGSYCWWFRNPANQWRLVVPLFTGFYDTSQVAVWDFWTVWEFPHWNHWTSVPSIEKRWWSLPSNARQTAPVPSRQRPRQVWHVVSGIPKTNSPHLKIGRPPQGT